MGTIGHYEILAKLGEGGMGEVYRARDTKLNRDVAIKVLPDLFARDPDRLARFEREAQTLASLNHPHIAQIYGVEARALVMELVEGEDLAQRLARGALPVDEALAIARQVAEALEAAHGRGIVHRDLKPANVKAAPDGTVKVLDFGLAKAVAPDPALSGVENSPTFTSPAMTQMGVILGTAAYMAPEQARGRAIDPRADIWAFGCLLYEMLTGHRAFEGEDVTETIGAIMRGEPDWALLPRDLSPAVSSYLRRCLQKNPRDRVQSAGDLRLALSGAFDVPVPAPQVVTTRPRWRMPIVAAGVVALAALAAALAWQFKPSSPGTLQRTRRFTLTPLPAVALANTNRDLVITPDGTSIVYLAGLGSARAIYIRRLDTVTPTLLRPALRDYEPTISPDSEWVAFNDESDYTLRKMSLGGGPALAIAKVGREILGAAWGPDGTIVYATDEGLWRVPAAGGGTPAPLAKPDRSRGEQVYAWPEFLPNGRTVLFTIRSGSREGDAIAALDLAHGTSKIVVRGGTNPRYSPSGHLLYVADGILRAVAFDPDALETHGEPVVIASGVGAKGSGAVDFAVSADGTLVYLNGGAAAAQRSLSWIARDGARQPINVPPRSYTVARISPDGGQIALDIREQQSDVWIWDVRRETLTRLTNDPGFDGLPVWTRDGSRIVFGSSRQGALFPFIQAADGTGEAQPLFKSTVADNPTSMTPDNRWLLFRRDAGNSAKQSSADIMMVAPDGHGQPQPLLAGEANELNGEVSPDGQWLAYESDESGSFEVYVRPFPQVQNRRIQISSGGGTHPAWDPAGGALYFVSLDGRLMTASWSATPSPSVGALRQVQTPRIYEAIAPRSYDISPDGKRILVIEPVNVGPADAPSLTVVLNWVEDLKRRGAGASDR